MRFSTIAAALTAPLLVASIPMKVKRASDNDKLVLQFAHVLELLETQFYQEALGKFVAQDFIDAGISVPDVAIQNFQGILQHEIAHTDFLGAALEAVGAQPVPGCTFNFDAVLTDVATMAAVARAVEAVGVGAYLGASVLVDDKNILVAAASILTIEARHQTILNAINGASSVPQAFDIALTPPQVLAIAGGFISGCDLGVPPNPALTITNQGTVAPGTLLTFDSPALAGLGDTPLFCQMLVGGAPEALALPLDQCIVPDGIDGPVAIFLTNNDKPLSSNVVVQDATTTVAGPTIAFIDTVSDALGALIRTGSGPVDSSEDITPDQAQQLIDNANGAVTDPASTDPTATTDPAAAPTNPAVDPAAPPADQVQITDPALDPTAPPVVDVPTNATPDPNAAPAPGAVPPIKVIGMSTVPL